MVETPKHLALKRNIGLDLKKQNFNVEYEKPLAQIMGRKIKVDIYAERGKEILIVEVGGFTNKLDFVGHSQWSNFSVIWYPYLLKWITKMGESLK